MGLWVYRYFEGVEWCWEVPGAAWFAASRPLGCVSDRTALVCVRLRLGIELVPVGGHEWSGGGCLAITRASKGMEKVNYSVLCVCVLVAAPVCCCSH